MIADIGAKPLASTRLRFLKSLMNLEEIKNDNDENKDLGVEKPLSHEGQGVVMDLERVSQAVKVITLLAVLGTANGQNDGRGR